MDWIADLDQEPVRPVRPKPAAVKSPNKIAKLQVLPTFEGHAIRRTAQAARIVAIHVPPDGSLVSSKRNTKRATNTDFEPIIGVTIEASPFSRAKKQVNWEIKKIHPRKKPNLRSIRSILLPTM